MRFKVTRPVCGYAKNGFGNVLCDVAHRIVHRHLPVTPFSV
ncbi:hypothetical protein PSI19_16025 [Xenorhabdus khoisanae]|nr:hypothetical protein [Xenorhabdus khoisanae]MDC9615346.1 hypothetical protein [Xenorhabdus khoisanae]